MAVDYKHHFRLDNFKRYGLQCGMAGIVVLVLLLVLDAVTQTVLIASLGASAFIAFALPRSVHSGHRHLIGGYVVGMASGVLMAFFYSFAAEHGVNDHAIMIIFGALAISTAMFIMVVTRSEHPPAAALALGLVLNEWDLMTLAVIMIGIIALSLAKRLVLPMLMDLV